MTAASSTSIVTTTSRPAQTSATDEAPRAPAAAEARGLGGDRVVHREIVPAAQDAARHALAHAPETDEADVHEKPLQKWVEEWAGESGDKCQVVAASE